MSKYPIEEKYGIRVEEFIVSGNPDWDSWMTVHDSNGTHLVHYIGDPNEEVNLVEGEEEDERTNIERSRPIRVAKHREGNTRRTAKTKKLPVRKVGQKE